MERRHSQRVPFSLDAKIIADGRIYAGSIENVSEDGMEYLMTSFINASKDFAPDKKIVMNFQAPSGETVNLDCEVKWYIETNAEDENLLVGMKIINLAPKYKELIRNIYTDNSH